MKTLTRSLGLLVLGAVAGGAAVAWFGGAEHAAPAAGASAQSTDPEPLYWVAPMDPDYRRDGPGKSPMGMDLVPV